MLRLSRDRDRLLVNVRLLGQRGSEPEAAIAMRNGRIAAVGPWVELREIYDEQTQVVDGNGGLAIPAFHDAHMHFAAWARSASKTDCRGARNRTELRARLRAQAGTLQSGTWLQAIGLDEDVGGFGPRVDKQFLDSVDSTRPIRIQSTTLHLDVLNSAALYELGLWAYAGPEVERDGKHGQPTGRIYHGAELLRTRSPKPGTRDLAAAIRRASDRLLAYGITSIQDATPSNGAERWHQFQTWEASGALRVRTFMLWGVSRWQELSAASPPTSLVRHGHLKALLSENSLSPAATDEIVLIARRVGKPVAFHAVSEAELVVALHAIAELGNAVGPCRVEHAGVVPDELLCDLRRLSVIVVGQPALVAERGDYYVQEYDPSQYGWLHRAQSYLRSGIPYAMSSDAPATDPAPSTAIAAALTRRTPNGILLGNAERLTFEQAIAAMTQSAAAAACASGALGTLRVGGIADIAVLGSAAQEFTNLTIMNGEVVWNGS
jgi:predicted amidohydrolase YtcJ